MTSLYDDYVHGTPYCRPEGYYFWVYYFFMNFIWIVVPGCKLRYNLLFTWILTFADLLYQSVAMISSAMGREETVAKKKSQ